MNDNEILQIDGLSALQLEELKSELKGKSQGNALIDAPQSALGRGRHGEPDLLSALIQLTPIVLSVVSLWLAKQKGKRTEQFSYKKKSPDGALEEIDFKRSAYQEGATSASQIESILKSKLDGTPTGTPA